mmetsp:Transcript_33651/g.41224  ORF Transcript_33651/g.41224 Transcript_33651/m.41224 type:complete len:118 (-) Transcript_33651:399-752(-)
MRRRVGSRRRERRQRTSYGVDKAAGSSSGGGEAVEASLGRGAGVQSPLAALEQYNTSWARQRNLGRWWRCLGGRDGSWCGGKAYWRQSKLLVRPKGVSATKQVISAATSLLGGGSSC